MEYLKEVMSKNRPALVDFNFESEDGNAFFVEMDVSRYDSPEDALVAAEELASEVDDNAVFQCTVSPEEAEEMGLDTY